MELKTHQTLFVGGGEEGKPQWGSYGDQEKGGVTTVESLPPKKSHSQLLKKGEKKQKGRKPRLPSPRKGRASNVNGILDHVAPGSKERHGIMERKGANGPRFPPSGGGTRQIGSRR